MLRRSALSGTFLLSFYVGLQYLSSFYNCRVLLLDAKDSLWPQTVPDETEVVRGTKDPSLKYILYYTRYFGRGDFDWGEGKEPFADCPVSSCYATADPTVVQSTSDFDAFIYHAHFDRWIERPEDISTWRKPHHRFILFGQESPANHPMVPEHSFPELPDEWYSSRNRTKQIINDHPYNSFFNWTMTHRWDSDIPYPYGWFLELPSNYEQNDQNTIQEQILSLPRLEPYIPTSWRQYNATAFTKRLERRSDDLRSLANRPHKVAWIVSNCGSFTKRESYVRELSRHIQVDIFGLCGNRTCSQSYDETNRITGELDNCTAAVRSQYKFYLAFENSFCDDYATEKFFSNVDTNVVVVLGQSNYTRIAPPRSYIDALDFASPKALAEFLHYLDHNDTEYLSYFWWKDYYAAISLQPNAKNLVGRRAHRSGLCRICEGLHRDDSTQVYHDLSLWYLGSKEEPTCGRNLPILTSQLEQQGGLVKTKI